MDENFNLACALECFVNPVSPSLHRPVEVDLILTFVPRLSLAQGVSTHQVALEPISSHFNAPLKLTIALDSHHGHHLLHH